MSQQSLFNFFKPAASPTQLLPSAQTGQGENDGSSHVPKSETGEGGTESSPLDQFSAEEKLVESSLPIKPLSLTAPPLSSPTRGETDEDDTSPIRPPHQKRRRLQRPPAGSLSGSAIAMSHSPKHVSSPKAKSLGPSPKASLGISRKKRSAPSPPPRAEPTPSPAASQMQSTTASQILQSSTVVDSGDPLAMTMEDQFLAELDAEERLDTDHDFTSAAEANLWAEIGLPPPIKDEDLSAQELPQHREAEVETLNVHAQSPETDLLTYYRNQVPVASGPEATMWKAFVEAYFSYCDRFDFPSWIDPRSMKDQNGHSVDSPLFDMSKIRVPNKPNQIDHKMHFTPALQQYWQLKSEYFDRIVFFKLGKFYEIFYTDACIMQGLCDLKWMGADEKAHVGFPEMALHTFAQKAVNAGYTVTVVEQMETPAEMAERKSVSSRELKPKAVKREVCEVYSQGTLAHAEMIGPEHNYLCALLFDAQLDRSESEASQHIVPDAELTPPSLKFHIKENNGGFGFVLVDVSSAQFFYGYARDEAPARPALRTLLAHTTPHEVVMLKQSIPSDIRALLRALPLAPQLSNVAPSKIGTTKAVVHDMLTSILCSDSVASVAEEAENEESETTSKLTDRLPVLNAEAKQKLLAEVTDVPSAALACLTCLQYLDTLLLRNKLLAVASIRAWAAAEGSEPHLTLDNAAMGALEILESRTGSKEDTLFAHLNKCMTAFGSRLLVRWLTSPLMDPSRIRERQESVEWLIGNPSWTEKLRSGLKRVPDLERLAARTFTRALQAERGAVMFADTVEKKIKQFLDLLDSFESLQDLASDFSVTEGATQSGRVGLLLRSQASGGLFPPILELVQNIKEKVVISGDERLPAEGSFPEFDEATKAVDDQKESLESYLNDGEVWESLGVPPVRGATYVHTKFRYEVEVSETHWRTLKTTEAEMTSTSKAGFVRFHTPEIKQMIFQLEALETRRTNSLFPFLQSLCKEFYSRADHFRAAIHLGAEVDVLACFAHNAISWSYGPMCRPSILDPEGNRGQIKIKQGVHPVICQRVERFVPNDFEIGTEVHPQTSIIITGPNMGGKSTLARQVALLVLMAQIGSRVPAESMELVPIDRIFARVGAYDAILEHRSTFFVELEETLNFLKHATPRSLGIIDEFGRGTSTSEGSALAAATISYIAEELGSLCLFSTHFQDRLHAHVKDKVKAIRFAFMGFDVDESTSQLIFHYQFRDGVCPNSHGVQVAKLAGIPADVIEDAERFRDEYNRQLAQPRPLASCI